MRKHACTRRAAQAAATGILITASLVVPAASASAAPLSSTAPVTQAAAGTLATMAIRYCVSEEELGNPGGTYVFCDDGTAYDARTGKPASSGRDDEAKGSTISPSDLGVKSFAEQNLLNNMSALTTQMQIGAQRSYGGF